MTTLAQFLQLPAAPIAVLTPTAAANLESLSLFDSKYDTYVLELGGIKPAADDVLMLRLATGGSVDTGSNYTAGSSGGNVTSTGSSITLTGTVLAAGKGLTGQLVIRNANDTSNLKYIEQRTVRQSDATPTWNFQDQAFAYFAANAVSGFRLYWNSASNFAASGYARVYALGRNA